MPDVLQLCLVFWTEPTPAGSLMVTTASAASGNGGAGCREGVDALAAGERETRGDSDLCGVREEGEGTNPTAHLAQIGRLLADRPKVSADAERCPKKKGDGNRSCIFKSMCVLC